MIIEWSPLAREEYFSLLDYLSTEWGSTVTLNFIKRVEHVLEHISNHPEMYPATEHRKAVRRCVVSKQTTLYYRVLDQKIQLITLFNTHQNPENLDLD